MDQARDVLNYIQGEHPAMDFERGGVTISEFEITDRDHARAIVWAKDMHALIEVTMIDNGWPALTDPIPGPLLYPSETRTAQGESALTYTHVLEPDGSITEIGS